MLVFVLAGTNAFAANHYIRSGASGANNGTDWTNAWSSLSQVSWTRGDVYYIAAGSYGTFTFSTSTSGTSTIEIRGAIGGTGDHGTSTGWSDSFQGQALLSGGSSQFSTSYWTINGQAVPGCSYPSNNDACYTIKFVNPAVGSSPAAGQALFLCNGSGTCTNYLLEYVDVLGSNTEVKGGNFSDEGIYCYQTCNNTTIDHSYVHSAGCDTLSFNSGNAANLVLSYDWIAYNDAGHANISGSFAHCQGIQHTAATFTAKYDVWQDIQSSGVITDAAGGNANFTEWDIYGNLFFWDAAWIAKWRGDSWVGLDNGIIGLYSVANTSGILRFYNNTITSPGLASSQNCTTVVYEINSPMVLATVQAYNNIWYNFNSSECGAGAGAAGTYDYNAYYQVSGGKGDNGAHSYSSSTNPFVNPAASTVAGFMLTADTNTGVQVASPFNTDMLGTTRGSSGIWDIGALQLSGTSSSLPPVPQNLHVVSIQ